MPEVLHALARTVAASSLVWRVTLSGLARWWRWRAERKWLVIPREDHRLEIQFAEWDSEYEIALELHRGDFFCSVPVTGPRMSLVLSGLAYERSGGAERLPEPPAIERPAPSLRTAIRAALAEIPRSSLPNRVKRGLRWWKLRRAGVVA
jgi:hypothetical protein